MLENLSATASDWDLRARALLLLSDLVYRRAGESQASVVAREALAAARDPILRARCQASLAVWSATVDVVAAAAAARDAVSALEDADAAAEIRSFALASLVRVDLFAGNGFDAAAAYQALELELAAPPASVDDRVTFKLGQWLRYVDDFDGARLRLVEAEQAAEDEGDESSMVNILLNRVVLELWAGAWRSAEEVAQRLAIVGDQLGVPHAAADWQAYLDAYVGRLDAVRDAALAADRSAPIIDMLYVRALGVVELAAGLNEDANTHLAEAIALSEQVGFREPSIWRIDGDAIEAAVAVGEVERAEQLLARFELQARRSRNPLGARCERPLSGARPRGTGRARRRGLGPGRSTGGPRALSDAARARADAARSRARPAAPQAEEAGARRARDRAGDLRGAGRRAVGGAGT